MLWRWYAYDSWVLPNCTQPEEFLSELIHRLNNRLTAVSGYSQILLLKLTSPDTREDVENILSEVGKISDILKNLSDYIKREPKKETVDINELVRKTIEARTHDLEGHKESVRSFLYVKASLP
jgi:signal transduction histidine kinase